MSKYKHQAVIDEFRLLVDDVIEEMESYIEEDNNMSYQDELHRRIMEASKQFLDEQLSKKEEEVEAFKSEAIDFILGGYPNAELMKHRIDIVNKTQTKK